MCTYKNMTIELGRKLVLVFIFMGKCDWLESKSELVTTYFCTGIGSDS
jgi:hypothetical protein